MESDYLDELNEDAQRLLTRINQNAHDLILLGSEMQRVEFFDTLRQLMAEKEMQDDQIAVDVLSWAYAKLEEL